MARPAQIHVTSVRTKLDPREKTGTDRAHTDQLPESYRTIGVNSTTKRSVFANDTEISRMIVQHRTKHGHFEAYRIRFDLEGIPKCKTDGAIMTDTHYPHCSRGQTPPDNTHSADNFSVQRLKKFRKEARAKGITTIEAIHRWHLAKGTTRFIEVPRKKQYHLSVGWVGEEEPEQLEPTTPVDEA